MLRRWNALLLVCLLAPAISGQTSKLNLSTGKDIFRAACAGCHGPDGKGAPDTQVGFEKPETFPDFTRCDQTTPELDVDWKATIRDGGHGRGFSPIMPSFRRRVDPAADRPGDRVPAQLLPERSVAARRTEPAARHHHRKGVSRKTRPCSRPPSTRKARAGVSNSAGVRAPPHRAEPDGSRRCRSHSRRTPAGGWADSATSASG